MNKLAVLRARSGLTLRALGEKAGVSQTTISRLETGKIKSSLITLGKLAKALEVDVTELADLAENPNTSALAIEALRAEPMTGVSTGMLAPAL